MLENELPEARTVTTKLLTVNSSLEALEKELLSLFAAIEKAETKKVKKELNDRLLDVQKRRNKLLKERGRLKEQLSRILIRNVPKKKKQGYKPISEKTKRWLQNLRLNRRK